MGEVRPTKRALDELALGFPTLTTALEELDHPLIIKAQQLPQSFESGSAERIRSITDRALYKIKVQNYRGAAALIPIADQFIKEISASKDTSLWWLLTAGSRKADSSTQDFYEVLKTECQRAATGSSSPVNSNGLLPQDIDYKRFVAELAALADEAIKTIVREAICRSAQNGHAWTNVVNSHKITAAVRINDGETYLAVATEGFLDQNLIAVILAAVPGITPDDWMIEPGEVLGIHPSRTQLVFSTILPTEVLASLLELHDSNHL